MKLNREKIQRMFNDRVGGSGSGSGGSGGDMPAGVATQAWTMENFLSIEFFSKLFKAYGPAETEGDPDVEIIPNDVEGTISNIQAMFGFWTEQYISALGQGSGGGGGGGDLNEPLASINTAGLATHPGSAGQTIVWNGSAWVYGSVLNSGVTSVGLSAPTGFNVTGSPITTSGTLALSFASGYELPLAADTAKGVTAYGWGDHSLAGYALASNVYSKTDADAKFLTISFFRSLFKAYTSASAEVVPNAGDTTTISSIKAMFGFWTEQYISALGQGSGGGGGITLNEPLASLNNAGLAAPSSAGQTLVWNGSTWKYSNAAGISTTSLNVGGSASISGALSVAGNISTSAGGFIVSGKDNTYVLLAGGGTKLLSEIGGGGAVNSITIGNSATEYTPDANGVVNIPAYPSTANLVSGISLNGNVLQPSSGIVALGGLTTSVKVGDTSYSVSSAGVVSLPAYPTVTDTKYTAGQQNLTATKLFLVGTQTTGNASNTYATSYTNANCYIGTDNCLYSNGSKVALGADLSDYLPLSGGTMTGPLTTNGKLYSPGMIAVGYASSQQNANRAEILLVTPSDYPCDLYLGNNSVYNWAISARDSSESYSLTVYSRGTGSHIVRIDYSTGNISCNGSISASSIIKTNGTSSQFLKADGSIDSNSYLQLTGGTLTGVLNTASNLYMDYGHYAVNLNNSDVIGANGIYFEDTADVWREGLLFIRSGGTYDTIRAYDGNAYLDVNNGSATYTIIHSGNINNYVGGGTADYTKFLLLKDNPRLSSANVNIGAWTRRGMDLSLIDSSTSDAPPYVTSHDGPLLTFAWDNSSWGAQLHLTMRYNDDMHWRSSDSNNGGWQAWKKILDSRNYGSYALPLTGGTVTGATTFSSELYASLHLSVGAQQTTFNNGRAEVDICTYANDAADLWFGTNNTRQWVLNARGSSEGNKFRINCHINSIIAMTLTTSGNIGIYQDSPSYRLHVSGVIYSDTGVYSAGYVTALSDIRKKDVREYMEMDYNIVADAPAIKFTWKDGRCGGKMQVGSIAQYWQKALPEAVSEMADGELSMSYGVIALLSSIATARKVRDHEQRIAELERENKELKERLKAA